MQINVRIFEKAGLNPAQKKKEKNKDAVYKTTKPPRRAQRAHKNAKRTY